MQAALVQGNGRQELTICERNLPVEAELETLGKSPIVVEKFREYDSD